MKLLCIIVNLIAYSYAIPDKITEYFKLYKESTVSSEFDRSYLIAKYSLRSAIDCVVYCNTNNNCLNAVFNKSSKWPSVNCYWYSYHATVTMTRLINSTFNDLYKKKGKLHKTSRK